MSLIFGEPKPQIATRNHKEPEVKNSKKAPRRIANSLMSKFSSQEKGGKPLLLAFFGMIGFIALLMTVCLLIILLEGESILINQLLVKGSLQEITPSSKMLGTYSLEDPIEQQQYFI